ncbi:MAG: PIN domain-containing protein [Candidatus Dormibacteraceae bacterium]
MPVLSGSLDTNVLLRLILNDVPDQHQAALNLFEDASGQFDVADTAIIELIFALGRHYDFTRWEMAKALESLMALTKINCNRTLFEKVLPLFIKYPKLSFEDCYLAMYADLNAAGPLWTFDQKLASQAPATKLIPPTS